jgi:hypothetical protein
VTTPFDQALPSLDVVREELEAERTALEKRSDGADTRAGIVLGFSGVMAGIAVNSKSGWAVPGLLVGVAAAVLAVRVVWPRTQTTIDPRALRGRYLAAPELRTKQAVLDTRIVDYEFNRDQVATKIKRLKAAYAALAAAVVLTLLGASLRLVVPADPCGAGGVGGSPTHAAATR